MPFTDHHDIVETFPSNRPNYPLGIRVLPRRARRNHDFPDAQRLGLTPKSFAIDLVSVSEQILRSLLQAARLEQLPRRPFRGRVLGNIEMHQPAPGVAQHHKHEEHSKSRRGYREEIQGDQILGVVLKKRSPRLRRRPPGPEHVLRTVACDTVTPSFSSSPWILGAPQSGLARLTRQISSRSSAPIVGRPRGRRLFDAQ